MTRSTPKQTTSSPRFGRGLALLLCAGILVALVVGHLCNVTDKDALRMVAASDIAESSLQQTNPEARAQEPVRQLSPREMFWQKTFAEIAGEADDGRREEKWAILAGQIPPGDIPATLDELQGLGGGESEFFQRLVRRWAEADGRAAAAWAGQLPAGAVREGALSSVAIEWGNVDLHSAVAWARQLPDTSERQTLLLAVSSEAVRAEPVEALRVAVELPADTQRDEVIRRAAMEWASRDAAGAVDWAEKIPDASLRSQVLAAATTAWADSAPESAATLAVESLPSGRLLDDTVVSLVQRWAQQQPEMAAAWVERFPEGELREAAVENLLVQWSQTDAEGADRWRAAHL